MNGLKGIKTEAEGVVRKEIDDGIDEAVEIYRHGCQMVIARF